MKQTVLIHPKQPTNSCLCLSLFCFLFLHILSILFFTAGFFPANHGLFFAKINWRHFPDLDKGKECAKKNVGTIAANDDFKQSIKRHKLFYLAFSAQQAHSPSHFHSKGHFHNHHGIYSQHAQSWINLHNVLQMVQLMFLNCLLLESFSPYSRNDFFVLEKPIDMQRNSIRI